MPSYGMSLSDLFLEGVVFLLCGLLLPPADWGELAGLPTFALDLFIFVSLPFDMGCGPTNTSYNQQPPSNSLQKSKKDVDEQSLNIRTKKKLVCA